MKELKSKLALILKITIVSAIIYGCGKQSSTQAPVATSTASSSPIPCSVAPVPANGVPGAYDQYGGALITCPNGSSYVSNGAPGSPAATATSVQFCPSVGPTVYPSVFPEYGLCLNDNLYGVYYDGHNAWLAQIVPGYYSSTSTSAPCSFHVLPSCVVAP